MNYKYQMKCDYVCIIETLNQRGTRESHKQLPKVMATRYTYHPGRHARTLYILHSFF